jgi:hypothetical protein
VRVKSNVSMGETYVIDSSEIAELDKLSMTSVISEAEAAPYQPWSPRPLPVVEEGLVDQEINTLLAEPASADGPRPGVDTGPATGTGVATAETPYLLAPELMFPDIPVGEREERAPRQGLDKNNAKRR